jgi:hypothetical protein
MLDKLESGFQTGKDIIKEKFREKCIESALEKIDEKGLKREDFTDEEFEILVKEAEDELISDVKDKSLIATIGGLAFTLLGGF